MCRLMVLTVPIIPVLITMLCLISKMIMFMVMGNHMGMCHAIMRMDMRLTVRAPPGFASSRAGAFSGPPAVPRLIGGGAF